MGIIGEVVVGEASETVHIGIVERTTGGESADADAAGQNKSCDARRAACVLGDSLINESLIALPIIFLLAKLFFDFTDILQFPP